jgi:hypothetical protein
MITVSETLFSKLVSGGDACLVTIDGVYSGYAKAGAAFQDLDGSFKVELVNADLPQSVVKKKVEHIDTGFEGLVYKQPTQQGFSIPLKTLSKDQLNFIHQKVRFDTDHDFLREDSSTHISFCNLNGWFYSHPVFELHVYNNSFNDIFVQGN